MTEASFLTRPLSDAVSAAAALTHARSVLVLEMKMAALFVTANVCIMVAGYMGVLPSDFGASLLVAAVTALAVVCFFRAWRQLHRLQLIENPPAYPPPTLRDWLWLGGSIVALLAALFAFGLLLLAVGHLGQHLLQGAR